MHFTNYEDSVWVKKNFSWTNEKFLMQSVRLIVVYSIKHNINKLNELRKTMEAFVFSSLFLGVGLLFLKIKFYGNEM